MNKILLGAIESLYLPELNQQLTARIDTGAKTSALHIEAMKIVTLNKGGRRVQFSLMPNQHNEFYEFDFPVIALRKVKSSNGEAESRPVIQTKLAIAQMQWDIEITLSKRDNMTHPMLLGREAMGNRVLIDPSETFLLN